MRLTLSMCLAIAFAVLASAASLPSFTRGVLQGSLLGSLQAAEPGPLQEQLKVFEPLLGKTFRSEFTTGNKTVVDISRWERALNGTAIRSLHSINDGEYGGETLMIWDAEKKCVTYWYFTTAGFRTEGKMEFDGTNKWTSLEDVKGSAGGITQVKGTSEITSDGKLVIETQYMKDGVWSPGRKATYTESPDSKVQFK